MAVGCPGCKMGLRWGHLALIECYAVHLRAKSQIANFFAATGDAFNRLRTPRQFLLESCGGRQLITAEVLPHSIFLQRNQTNREPIFFNMTSSACQLPDAIRDAKSLPSLPSVAIEVLRITKDPDAEIEDLVKAVSADPAMSLKILKLANSPQYRRNREITSLPQAAVVLGLKTVKLLALSFSLASSLPRGAKNSRFDFEEYWRHSLTTAVAAQSLARVVKVPYGDEAFLAGLLMRIGQLVMATTIQDEYAAAIEQSETRLPTAEVGRQVLGYDYPMVGRFLLESWGLPRLLTDSVAECVVSGDSCKGCEEDTISVCKLLQVGNLVAVLVGGTGDKGGTLKQLHEVASQNFGLSDEEVADLVVNLQGKVRETAAALRVDLPGENDFATIMNEARTQMLEVSLEAVADLTVAEEKAKNLHVASRTDKLTGLPNRAHFDARLCDMIDARLQVQSSSAFGILMIDVDNFKLFNDRFGHAAGDEVLASVAKRISENTRATDFAARYGGEEFVVILPNTSLSDLSSVAERLRTAVERGIVRYKESAVAVTISVGGACICDVVATGDGIALMELADQCLYQAKDAGRNQCLCREVKLEHA